MEDIDSLCRRALRAFQARCFDNLSFDPDRLRPEDCRIIADALMARGGKEAFLLGRRIAAEAAKCR